MSLRLLLSFDLCFSNKKNRIKKEFALNFVHSSTTRILLRWKGVGEQGSACMGL